MASISYKTEQSGKTHICLDGKLMGSHKTLEDAHRVVQFKYELCPRCAKSIDETMGLSCHYCGFEFYE